MASPPYHHKDVLRRELNRSRLTSVPLKRMRFPRKDCPKARQKLPVSVAHCPYPLGVKALHALWGACTARTRNPYPHPLSLFPCISITLTKGMTKIKLFFDGGCDCWKHTGYGSFEIESEGDGLRFKRFKVSRMKHPTPQTSNTAEYLTMIAGMKFLRSNADNPKDLSVEIWSDSKLVVEQMSGRWKIKTPHIKELVRQARLEASHFGKVCYIWHRRHNNVARFGH